MKREEVKEIIADILEADVEEIMAETELSSFETWDSVAVLAVIAEVESATGKYLHADDIKKLVTIEDLFGIFEA